MSAHGDPEESRRALYVVSSEGRHSPYGPFKGQTLKGRDLYLWPKGNEVGKICPKPHSLGFMVRAKRARGLRLVLGFKNYQDPKSMNK